MVKFFCPFRILYSFKYICCILQANPLRSLIYGVVIVLFITEVLVYYSATFSWYMINCEKSETCIKILLAADPQLIGLHNEEHTFFTPFSIWDSDKYLAKTFSYAYQFTKPDVVIFLGDLFDEGSTASDSEFKKYHNRFLNIFKIKQYGPTNYIWLPGDNDIGGEGSDWLTESKVRRFENIFQQPSIINVKNVRFCNVNRLTFSIPKVEKLSNKNFNGIIVGLSHMPLITASMLFVEEVIKKWKPHLFFTAHTHNFMIYTMDDAGHMEQLVHYEQDKENKIHEYGLGINNTVYEITIPTCSYRMGTNKIGYGFAVIDNKSIRYTTLWSPERLVQLKLYFVMTVSVLVSCLFKICIQNLNAAARKHFQQS